MEVGVLSGIARTQNADTDEGAEAQMSFHLRQNLFLFARPTFWPEKIYTSRKYCLTTDFCLWSKSPWCLCFRGVFSTYLPIYFAHLKHKMRFLLQILGCSYQTNFKTFGSWQTQFTAVLYWIFRRLRVGVPFPPCCRTIGSEPIQNMKLFRQDKTTSPLLQ